MYYLTLSLDLLFYAIADLRKFDIHKQVHISLFPGVDTSPLKCTETTDSAQFHLTEQA